ncbi:MAG: hypothetical protein QOH81_2948 [Sphingomonadales bacterium]|jgi:hypothetical protein|nr:hypothetical protein [Sphingomonadales bacterium]
MTRLLTLLMVLAFVVSQGTSFAASICRHQSAQGHSIALQSHDRKIASQAFTEEAAGSVASKKGSPADAGSPSPASDMLAPATFVAPARIADAVRRRLTDAPRLPGTSVRPLLPPPLG